MRGLLLCVTFFALLPLIFTKGPFIGILIWFWISLMVPQANVWGGVFGSIPYAMITAVATFVSWLLMSNEQKLPPADKTTLLLALLMIWISITTLFGIGPRELVNTEWLLTEKMLLMTLVAYALITTRQRLDQLILVCVFSVAFYGFKGGIWTVLKGGSGQVLGPSGSMIGQNNELGTALTVVLPLLFYIQQRYPSPRFKWPMRAMIGFTLLGALFTYSRGALLAISAAGGMVWLRSRHKLASAVVILVIAVGVYNFAPPAWFAKMHTIQTYEQDDSANSRFHVWGLSWGITRQHPITGGGMKWGWAPAEVNRQLAGTGLVMSQMWDTHSIWFGMLSQHGFPGLALFIAIIWATASNARWLIRNARGHPDFAWADNLGRMLQASLVGYCVAGTFGSMQYYDGFYAVVIIAAAARRVVAGELANIALARKPVAIEVNPRSQSPLRPQPIG